MADEVDPPGEIMAPKIRPSDIGSKVKRESIHVDGWKWSYLDAPAEGQQRAVAVLIHGFPDQSFAWRYQFPLLTSLGIRTIALDCMGYGETGASEDLKKYGFKTHADVVAAIAKTIGSHKIIIGGHDWGGAAVYRVAQWYPHLVSHIFSVCTSYAPPTKNFVSTKTLSETILPQFGYQLQLGSEDNQIENVVKDEKAMRQFLLGMYGGKPSSRRKFMTPEKGIVLDIIVNDYVGKTPLFNDEEFEYYVQQFMKNGIHGPCNWYRTRKINYEDDLHLPAETRNHIKQPTLYILATRDSILTRAMSRNMDKAVPNLTRGEVPATHWALWHTPDETNKILKEWLEGVVLGKKSKL